MGEQVPSLPTSIMEFRAPGGTRTLMPFGVRSSCHYSFRYQQITAQYYLTQSSFTHCLWSGLYLSHVEMSRLKSYTIFALKASTSSITSHNITCIIKRATHAVSFKGNLYNPTFSDGQIVYKLLFQFRLLLQSLFTLSI